jgi:dTDP-4-dehydrorhamnose 3,5-epimerase
VEVKQFELPGLLLLQPKIFRDGRGAFLEGWHDERYTALGIPGPFLQDNVSRSMKGVLRGLHFQHPNDQGKLVQVLQGEVFDVAVDVRRGSPTFGQWAGAVLSAENARQLWIPEGFAHGFCVTSREAVFAYKCTEYYHRPSEQAVSWNDPDIRIQWPVKRPSLSDRDRNAPCLKDLDEELLPMFEP